MDTQLLARSEELIKEIERLDRFGHRYRIYPFSRVARLSQSFRELAECIPTVDKPSSQEQLFEFELRRRLNGEAFFLEQLLSPRNLDFNTVLSIYGVPLEDVEGLEEWLLKHRDSAFDAIDRLFELREVKGYELELQKDVPLIRRQAQSHVETRLVNYHNIIGEMLRQMTDVGEFLHNIHAVPTEADRSYFHTVTKSLSISIPSVCFTNENGVPQIREREFIELYGHEGMGHGLQNVLTQKSSLPYFLKWESPETTSTCESVAQFYENVIFDELRRNPDVLRDLDILHKFDDIYREHLDVRTIDEYKRRLARFAILVLGNKDLGDPKDPKVIREKVRILERVTLAPQFPTRFIEGSRDKFDSEGNLDTDIVSELRYCAQPVARALEEFKEKGMTYDENRSKIDRTLLTGFWSPGGYVHNARLAAISAAGAR